MNLFKKMTTLTVGLICFGSSNVMATDLPFTVSMNIYAPLAVTQVTALNMGNIGGTAAGQSVVVAPAAAGAASFDITGEASVPVTASVVEPSLGLVNGATTITIGTFTFGGALAANGTATTTAAGAITGAKVGATATIPANPVAGAYSGTLTFRVVYQ